MKIDMNMYRMTDCEESEKMHPPPIVGNKRKFQFVTQDDLKRVF